jgi:hypothetical protein
MEVALRAVNTIKSLGVRLKNSGILSSRIGLTNTQSRLRTDSQDTRLSALRPPSEFFDPNRITRPADLNQAVSVRWIPSRLSPKLD